MNALDQICEVLSKLPMDDAGRKQADELIAVAKAERTAMVDVLKAVEHAVHEEGDSFGRCPECDAPSFKPHFGHCDLGKILAGHRVESSQP